MLMSSLLTAPADGSGHASWHGQMLRSLSLLSPSPVTFLVAPADGSGQLGWHGQMLRSLSAQSPSQVLAAELCKAHAVRSKP